MLRVVISEGERKLYWKRSSLTPATDLAKGESKLFLLLGEFS